MRSKTRKHNSKKHSKTRKVPLAGQAIAAGGLAVYLDLLLNVRVLLTE